MRAIVTSYKVLSRRDSLDTTFKSRTSTISCGVLTETELGQGFLFRMINLRFHHSYFISYLIIPDDYVWNNELLSDCHYHPDTRALLALYLPERFDLWDFSFLVNRYTLFRSPISEPALLVENALLVIDDMQRYARLELQKRKKAQVDVYVEELFQRSLHPRRVAAWIEAGMDI